MKFCFFALGLALSFPPGISAAAADSTSAETHADPFATGTVWAGQRFYKRDADGDGKGKGKGKRWSLRVETRDGEKFTGTIVLRDTPGNTIKMPVQGTAPVDGSGYVGFATIEKKGEANFRFSGSMKNSFVELQFSGRSLSGEEVAGRAGLSPKAFKEKDTE